MNEQYHSKSQQRILKVLFALAGHETKGLEPSALAKGLQVAASAITRDLSNLEIAGVAEKMPSGNYRLLPKIVQISFAFGQELSRERGKLDEIENRYTRQPN